MCDERDGGTADEMWILARDAPISVLGCELFELRTGIDYIEPNTMMETRFIGGSSLEFNFFGAGKMKSFAQFCKNITS